MTKRAHISTTWREFFEQTGYELPYGEIGESMLWDLLKVPPKSSSDAAAYIHACDSAGPIAQAVMQELAQHDPRGYALAVDFIARLYAKCKEINVAEKTIQDAAEQEGQGNGITFPAGGRDGRTAVNGAD